NAGQDTLSLATLGAQVLGVDISDEAISFARSLARDADIPARFERADVYDWLSGTDERFEIAFSSYGVLGWLSDLSTWARGIARILEPGGRFVLLEFHSMIYMFEDALSGTDGAAGAGSEDEPLGERLRLRYAYSGGAHYSMEEGVSDYVAASEDGLCPQGYETGIENFANPHRSEEFAWGIEDTVSAILDAGLHLTCLREYPYSAGCRQFPFMKDIGGRRYALPGGPQGVPYIPHMFGLIAVKP
ncbi:MAG: class I SAM-dependent methyltransferase, partial [Myxococcota bacterium]